MFYNWCGTDYVVKWINDYVYTWDFKGDDNNYYLYSSKSRKLRDFNIYYS